MLNGKHISVVIPALNEERAIRRVLTKLSYLQGDQGRALIDDIVVCDNGSTDRTAEVSHERGARVVFEAEQGYGAACLKAIDHLGPTDIVLFIDGDASCKIPQCYRLLEPLCSLEHVDMVIGSRTLGEMEAGALTPPQRMGNVVATTLIAWLWRTKVTDLGPFRAIRYDALKVLNMRDRQFGWTVEMQVKAIQQGFTTLETPVDSTRRIGVSKISGTLKGVIGAGLGIIGKIIELKRAELSTSLDSSLKLPLNSSAPRDSKFYSSFKVGGAPK